MICLLNCIKSQLCHYNSTLASMPIPEHFIFDYKLIVGMATYCIWLDMGTAVQMAGKKNYFVSDLLLNTEQLFLITQAIISFQCFLLKYRQKVGVA